MIDQVFVGRLLRPPAFARTRLMESGVLTLAVGLGLLLDRESFLVYRQFRCVLLASLGPVSWGRGSSLRGSD